METARTAIARADVQSTKVPTVRSHEMAIGTTRHQENVIVRLYTNDGLVGIGEAPHMVGHSHAGETPDTVRVVLETRLLQAVGGLCPLDTEVIAQALDTAVPGNSRAKGAVVMAAFDLAGKLLGTPVHTLLGGRFRDRVPLSWSLPIVPADVAIDEAHRMVERGWRVLKIKAGRPDPRDDVDLVRRLREELGDGVRLRVDANQAYELKTALAVIKGLEPFGVDFLEQPVRRDDLAGMRYLTREAALTMPIMADESVKSCEELAEICMTRAADYVSIYVIGPGGIDRSRKMAVLAEAFGMRGYVGGALESGVGAAAGLHLAASAPAIDLGCELYGQFMLEQDLVLEPPPMVDGALLVPTCPGLGVELDQDKVAAYRLGDVTTLDLERL